MEMTDRQKKVVGAIGAGLGTAVGMLLFDIPSWTDGSWGADIGAFLGVLLAMGLGSVLINRRGLSQMGMEE